MIFSENYFVKINIFFFIEYIIKKINKKFNIMVYLAKKFKYKMISDCI